MEAQRWWGDAKSYRDAQMTAGAGCGVLAQSSWSDSQLQHLPEVRPETSLISPLGGQSLHPDPAAL